MARRWVALWIVALGLYACAPSLSPTALPTQPLIPPTITDTPVPVTPSATPPPLPAPEDLLTAVPTESTVLIPVGAQPLVQLSLSDLSEALGVDQERVQLVRLEAVTWDNVDLGCGDDRMPQATSLAINGFRVVLAVDGIDYEYHTDGQSRVRLCPQNGAVIGASVETLILADPIAAELVALAQRRLARDLDLPARRIRLVDVSPVHWTDSSLGCPLPDANYAPGQYDGYRIVLEAGDKEYIYHSDFDRVQPCDASAEVMPDESATPEPSA
jgi:hypothetical protein